MKSPRKKNNKNSTSSNSLSAKQQIKSVSGDNINTLEWHDNNPTKITNQQILAKQSELQALEDVYVNRRKEYGNWESQLDEIYHNGLDSWKAKIANIKLRLSVLKTSS